MHIVNPAPKDHRSIGKISQDLFTDRIRREGKRGRKNYRKNAQIFN